MKKETVGGDAPCPGHDKRTQEEARLVLAWLKMLSKTQPFKLKPGRRLKAALASDIDFGDWLPQAKFAAMLFAHPNPELFKGAIEIAATIKHKQFFVDLGKCLSGDLDRDLWDKREVAIAEIVLSNPRMRAKDAVRELARRGHQRISEENFRNWKSKLLRGKREYDAFRSGENVINFPLSPL